ncbi:MAG: hypothetical protein ACLUFF_03820 [Acutalibacteraceae bacterium]
MSFFYGAKRGQEDGFCRDLTQKNSAVKGAVYRKSKDKRER